MDDAQTQRERSLARRLRAANASLDSEAVFHEPIGHGLNNLFLLRVDGIEYLGRKLLDDQGQFSSRLRPDMLLGALLGSRLTPNGLSLRYRPLPLARRVHLFERAPHRADNRIHFPFPVLDENARELVAGPAFWNDPARLGQHLDEQESHLRDYCVQLLRTHLPAGAHIHDPACSTGAFISSLARAMPAVRCSGADLSREMIEHACRRHRLANLTFTVADAACPAVPAGSCDVLILRFLNAEVMLREQAVALFHALAPLIKPDGRIILFGHTPVLFAVDTEARRSGLRSVGSLANLPRTHDLCQFYQLERH